MLHILLMILKIIGIVLLCILGLVLLLILMVLLVPVRYKGAASYAGELSAHVTVSYLLHILHVTVDYDAGGVSAVVRIFGIPLFKKNVKDNSSEKINNDSEAAADPEIDPKGTADETSLWDAVDELGDSVEIELTQEEIDALLNPVDIQSADVDLDKTIGESRDASDDAFNDMFTDSESEESIDEIIRIISSDTEEDKDNIKYTLEHIYDKITDIADGFKGKVRKAEEKRSGFENIWWFVTSYSFHACINKCWKEIKVILKRLLPGTINIDAVFGVSEPHITGYIMAALSALSGMVNGGFYLTPDFREKRLEGSIDLKGYIMVILFIVPGIKILLDENVRACFKEYKKIKNTNKNSTGGSTHGKSE